nr:hypothetical protein [Desulforhabdus sp. TSK]
MPGQTQGFAPTFVPDQLVGQTRDGIVVAASGRVLDPVPFAASLARASASGFRARSSCW